MAPRCEPPVTPPSDPQVTVEDFFREEARCAITGDLDALIRLIWTYVDDPTDYLGRMATRLAAPDRTEVDTRTAVETVILSWLGLDHLVEPLRQWMYRQPPRVWAQASAQLYLVYRGLQIDAPSHGVGKFMTCVTNNLTWDLPITAQLLEHLPHLIACSPCAGDLYSSATPERRAAIGAVFQRMASAGEMTDVPPDWMPEDPVDLWRIDFHDLYLQPESSLTQAGAALAASDRVLEEDTPRLGYLVCAVRGLAEPMAALRERWPAVNRIDLDDASWLQAITHISRSWDEPSPVEFMASYVVCRLSEPNGGGMTGRHLIQLARWPRVGIALASRHSNTELLAGAIRCAVIRGQAYLLPTIFQFAREWLAEPGHLRALGINSCRYGGCYQTLDRLAGEHLPNLWAPVRDEVEAIHEGRDLGLAPVEDWMARGTRRPAWEVMVAGDSEAAAQWPEFYTQPRVQREEMTGYISPSQTPITDGLVARLLKRQGARWLYENCAGQELYCHPESPLPESDGLLTRALSQYCNEHPTEVSPEGGLWMDGVYGLLLPGVGLAVRSLANPVLLCSGERVPRLFPALFELDQDIPQVKNHILRTMRALYEGRRERLLASQV